MDAVTTQHGRGACSNPHASQGVGIHLILFNKALTLLVHVNTAVLTVMYLVVSHYRVAVGANLCNKNSLHYRVFPTTDLALEQLDKIEIFKVHMLTIKSRM